jgi:RimJ/RimL family protein N-acetyltransferase
MLMSRTGDARLNEFGQPVGVAVLNWSGSKTPKGDVLDGRLCRLEALDAGRHADDLADAFALDPDGRIWTYMASGPFASKGALKQWLTTVSKQDDPLFYAIVDKACAKAVGIASYMRIAPTAGSIEVGSIAFSPLMQRTPLATEAMFLMMQHAFEALAYRRYEWKCDALNAASRKAALRYGFRFEGIFRQALVYKGRNRDTAWFSILDREWPAVRAGFTAWLAPENFDQDGGQKKKLSELIDWHRSTGEGV